MQKESVLALKNRSFIGCPPFPLPLLPRVWLVSVFTENPPSPCLPDFARRGPLLQTTHGSQILVEITSTSHELTLYPNCSSQIKGFNLPDWKKNSVQGLRPTLNALLFDRVKLVVDVRS